MIYSFSIRYDYHFLKSSSLQVLLKTAILENLVKVTEK